MAEIRGALGTKITESALIKTGTGKVYGVVVASNTAGTIKLWNALTATGTVLVDTFAFTTATSQVVTFPEPINFTTGLYATIGGTANVTVVFN